MNTHSNAQPDMGTAPRITLADIQKNILTEYYFTAHDGATANILQNLNYQNMESQERGLIQIMDIHPSMSLLTICVLVLNNGFTVHGVSACASPENYNEEIGKSIARQDAINKVWPLMGYELRSELSGNIKRTDCTPGWVAKLKEETLELRKKLNGLDDFIIFGPTFEELSRPNRELLRAQQRIMAAYLDVLKERLAMVMAESE